METRSKHFRKRDAILACLKGTTVHPSADWVFAQLKPEFPDLSLGTVYRNLTYFKEQGLIISLGTVNGVERFDGNVEPHVHFVCDNCNQVIDLPDMAIPQSLVSDAASQIGATITNASLTFSGICGECSTKLN